MFGGLPIVNGPQPFKFNLDDANCATDWQNWLRGFELFAKANRMEETSTKKDWLLHYAGPKVQDVYFNTPQPEKKETTEVRCGPLATGYVAFQENPYEEVVYVLQEFFAPKKNVTFERHVFRQTTQKTNERIDSYVMRLRIQANRCDFGEQLDTNIKDQITSGCSSSSLRRKILERDGSLDEIIKMARIIESVAEQQKVFGDGNAKNANDTGNAAQTAEVCKIENQRKDFRRAPLRQPNPNMECHRCGLKGHKASYEKCPAKGKSCNKCGKNDHFAKKCMTRSSEKRGPADKNKDEGPQNKMKREEIKLIENPLLTQTCESDEDIFMVQSPAKPGAQNEIWCTIGSIEVRAVVDSGSKFNIVDRETWMELKAKNVQTISRKKEIDTGFRSYGGYRLKFLGMFEATLQVAAKQIRATFYVADETGKVLIGLDSATELKIIKIGYDVNNINKAGDATPFGKIKGVIVDIPIKDNVKAVQQPYRRVPAPLEKLVDGKIDELWKSDIIEKVDTSNWISPLVVVPKPDNPEEVRICVDMKRANEAVARENHPLPTIDDFLPELESAEFFSKFDVKQAFHQVDTKTD